MDRKRKQSKYHRFSLPNVPLNSTTPIARRRPQPTKQQDKPYYKVVYPLRNRKKYGIGSDCNAAPNAEYTVTGQGYNFTRHNNKLTMNINPDVFFGDSSVPIIKPFPNRGAIRRQASLPPIQNPKEQKKLLHAELQQKLEENLQAQEKLHHNLIKVTVKLEEKKYKQQIQEMKMIEQHDNEINEVINKQKQERKEIREAQMEEIKKLKSQLITKVDDVKTEAAHRHFLLKDQIAQKEKIIKQDKEKSKVDMVKNLQRKNEELISLHERAIEDRKMEITNKLNQKQLAQIRETEKQYKCIIADGETKHQQEIEKLFKKFEISSRKEMELRNVTKLLKDKETEIEQLKLEKADIISQQENTKANTREVTEELDEYKRKFQAEVDKVKRRNCNTISELNKEAIQLKEMLSRKTDEIIEMKIEEDRRSRESLFRIRKSMLQARFSIVLPTTIKVEDEAEAEESQDSTLLTETEDDN